jgi:hypothetical protein
MTTMAGLLKAIPQNFAYGLSALIDSKGGAPAPAPEAVVADEVAETPAGVEEAGSPASDDDATPVAEVEEEAPVAESVEEEAPAAESDPETPEASTDVAEAPAE